jgi:hypothetical protein
MNRAVAHGARLIFLRLVVCRPDRPQTRKAMALQAQQIDLAHAQETRIRRAMRSMATGAAFGFDRHVLVHERALLVGMALVANRFSTLRGAHLAQSGRAVHVVAVAALDPRPSFTR